MDDHEPTIRSRELGEGLRRAMKYAGLNGQQVARPTRLVTELGVPATVRQTWRERGAGVGIPGGVPGDRRGA